MFLRGAFVRVPFYKKRSRLMSCGQYILHAMSCRMMEVSIDYIKVILGLVKVGNTIILIPVRLNLGVWPL